MPFMMTEFHSDRPLFVPPYRAKPERHGSLFLRTAFPASRGGPVTVRHQWPVVAGASVVLALFIGVTKCVSAIPVIAKTLSDMRVQHAA